MSRTLPAVPARNRPYPTGDQPPAEPLPEPRCTRRPGPEPGGAAGQSRSAPYPVYDCSTSQCVGRFPSVASSSKIFICHLRCFPLAGTLGSCCQCARKHGGPRPGEHTPHPDGRRGQRHPHRARRSAAAEPHARVPKGHRPSSRKAEAGAQRRDRSRAGPGVHGRMRAAPRTRCPRSRRGGAAAPSRSVERKTARSQPEGSLLPQHPPGALEPPKASARARTALLGFAAGTRRGALPRPLLGGHGSGEPRRRAASG